MAAFIAFIATLNLCVGYALGVYIGHMPGITPRRSEAENDDDEPIELAAPAAPAAMPASAPIVTPAKLAEKSPSKSVSSTPPPPDPPEHAPPAPESADSSNDYILEGLAAFKSKLAKVSSTLSESTEDRDTIDHCADELKQANSDYLEQSTVAMEMLHNDDDSSTSLEQLQLRQSIADQSAEIQRANDEIDEILLEEDTQVVREKLLASSEQLVDQASSVEQAVEVAASARYEGESSADIIANIDKLLTAIDDHLSNELPDEPLQVAAIAIQGEGELGGEQTERLFAGIQQIVAAELADDQSMSIDEQGRLMLVLAGDDEPSANERCERIRQTVAAATFVQDGDPLRASAQCAVADTLNASDRGLVLKRLEDSLNEANKLGDSRTFHHDGKMAAPVKTLQLSVESLEVAI